MDHNRNAPTAGPDNCIRFITRRERPGDCEKIGVCLACRSLFAKDSTDFWGLHVIRVSYTTKLTSSFGLLLQKT